MRYLHHYLLLLLTIFLLSALSGCGSSRTDRMSYVYSLMTPQPSPGQTDNFEEKSGGTVVRRFTIDYYQLVQRPTLSKMQQVLGSAQQDKTQYDGTSYFWAWSFPDSNGGMNNDTVGAKFNSGGALEHLTVTCLNDKGKHRLPVRIANLSGRRE